MPSVVLRIDQQASRRDPPPRRIVFVSERDGEPHVFSIRSDGSDPRPIARGPGEDFPGPVGPAGELLIVSSAGGRESLSLASRQLVTSGRVRHPSWFPNGTAIAFESDRESFRDIYRVDRVDGSVTRLTHSEAGCFEPAVSPDGKRVAYTCSAEDGPEIFARDLDSERVARLTWSSGEDSAPAWSPDGRHIAYLSVRRGLPRVYLMDADGAHPRPLRARIDHGVIGERDHAWSPDGKAIALVEQREGRANIRIVRVSDGFVTAITNGGYNDATPAWSPDGRELAFTSDRGGQSDILTMKRDGSRVRHVTRDAPADWLPRWVGEDRTNAHNSG
jgi:Tol biopolymer transport system component